jgi:cysteinyl-tRNA synthetase
MLDTHYDHKLVEEGKYQSWKDKGYFLSGDLTKTKFSMVIPPPNVTGMLHLGHAWNTTVQDIIARYKKAKGYDVTKWEEVKKVIPLMREDSILKEESVKLGKFQGHETTRYVSTVTALYEAICKIHPEK